MTQPLQGFFLGRRAYAPTFALMQDLFEARRTRRIGDTVLLLEHEPVVTLGRGAKKENLLGTPQQYAELGIDVAETGRGGDVTLHAPGQLVCYPIVDLSPDRRDVRKYVGALTATMNDLVAPFGIEGGTVDGLIGLWVDTAQVHTWPGEASAQVPQKLGAIGVRISRWITTHGFALNLTTRLDYFRWIVPCGISEHGVTSVERLTGACPSVHDTARQALDCLNRRLGTGEARWRDLAELSSEGLQGTIAEHFSSAQ